MFLLLMEATQFLEMLLMQLHLLVVAEAHHLAHQVHY
jgi:hypothetical protein